jgi:hypothetical protein
MNLYRQLIDLLPKRPLQVGTVVSVANGVCTVELPGGATEAARGNAQPGQRVWLRDGAIEGVAPDLPLVSAEV